MLGKGEAVNAHHNRPGGGYSRTLHLLDPSLVENYLAASNDDAIEGAHALATYEGIFGGFSSGANLFAAVSLLRGREKGNAVAFLVCDSGLKYLSTDLYL